MKPAEAARAKARRAERGAAVRIAKYGWYLIEKAVRKNVLPAPSLLMCVDCGVTAETYDHRFYSRPLDVVPVCRSCNKKRGSAYDLEILAEEASA